jgi:hypothetical protein
MEHCKAAYINERNNGTKNVGIVNLFSSYWIKLLGHIRAENNSHCFSSELFHFPVTD